MKSSRPPVFLCACVAALLLAGAGAGCDKSDSSNPSTASSGANQPKVVYITNGVADFWTIAKTGAEAGGREFGANVDVLMPKDIEEQKRMVEDSLSRGVDGIAISPINSANQGDLINRAAEETKIITHDSDAPGTKRLCYVGMDNYDAGRMCGKIVKDALPEGGSVVILVGRIEQDNARRRRQGLIDELMDRPHDPEAFDPPGKEVKGDKFTVLETLTDQFSRETAKNNAQNALGKYPDLDCMVGLFEYNPPAMLEALGARAGKDITVVGFDEADATLQAIHDGRCVGTVVQDPYRYGRESVRILAALHKGDQSALPPGGFLDIPARRIVKDNVAEFWADKNQKLGKGPPPIAAGAGAKDGK
jgi:ribose transport system substrate-binding protein